MNARDISISMSLNCTDEVDVLTAARLTTLLRKQRGQRRNRPESRHYSAAITHRSPTGRN